MKISCPNCGHHYEVEEEFAGMSVDCSSCGKPFTVVIPEKTKRCPMCGEEILAVAKKCKHCGEYLDQVSRQIAGSNPSYNVDRVSYTLVGLFLGCIGIHNFMDGNTRSGFGKIIIAVLALFFLIVWGVRGIPAVMSGLLGTAVWTILDLIKGPTEIR